MKTILGLDLGTNSIGWALVKEAENENEVSDIIKLGVRVNPLTVDELTNFEGGKAYSNNSERTLKRGARRNLQRYKLRRENLIDILLKNGLINKDTALTEVGKETTHETLKLRSKSANEKVSLEDLAKILLSINKKRGYKSSRKVNAEDDGVAIDGMEVAKLLYDENMTPGEYVLKLLESGKKHLPDFYRSDLQEEFNLVWKKQSEFYPLILTKELFFELHGKNKSQTWAICKEPLGIVGVKLKGTAKEQKFARYRLRKEALTQQVELEHLAIVLQDINNDSNKSSGYLGAISDRSKELFFNKETVGQYQYKQLQKDPNTSLKNQVFYRQDYLDEFEVIWRNQAKFYPQLTNELKQEIRDVVIFYQRKLKSQKNLISFCQFESTQQNYVEKETGKTKIRTIGRRVIPRSSPLFQEFKIWQSLNNLKFVNSESNQIIQFIELEDDVKKVVFDELNLRGDLKPNQVLKILSKYMKIGKLTQWKCNLEEIEGNRTNSALYNVFQMIAEEEGYGFNWGKKSALEIKSELKAIFSSIGINDSILDFDFSKKLDQQLSYQLWHLLYSAEEGNSKITEEDKFTYGNTGVALKKKLHLKFGFKPEYSTLISNLRFTSDYGNLSSKAISKILPFLRDGSDYSKACQYAGYNHSNSLSADELDNRELKPKLELLKKNSLRNPVVEKILNQMVNVVNQVIDNYGKPDEVRIELARELKKSAKERSQMTKNISDATRRNAEIKKYLSKEFGIPNPTKGDVIRYRLWEELASNGYKDLFRDKYIPKEKLFSNEIDIEHIIPKALLFDDSFSNKTLAFKVDNLKKADRTAFDFMSTDFSKDVDSYIGRIETLHKDGKISSSKYKKLMIPKSKLVDGFIERDLRNTQYIAKQARKMLLEVFKTVVPTTGKITDKLREDWDLINVMKELNFPKYKALGLTKKIERFDVGSEKIKSINVIEGWSKRNDHRHHAMDALAVAFTTHNHIQYLNYLNARKDIHHEMHGTIKSIENQIIGKDVMGKRRFIPPISDLRMKAKLQIESILISFKNKNKVVTWSVNKTKLKGKDNYNKRRQLTPRGQLHKETVYGKIKLIDPKPLKLNNKFTLVRASMIVDKVHREIVLQHLSKYDNNSEVAFDSKTIKIDPILIEGIGLKEVVCYEDVFKIRKKISGDNFKNEKHLEKVIDEKVKQILKDRVIKFQGNFKEAFSNLEENPIWLNKSKGIAVKSVAIKGVNNAESLHEGKDHFGDQILDKNKKQIPVDFVSTGNNHHVGIYEDKDGNLQERVVSFFEAVTRVNEGLPIIDKTYNSDIGWKFKFTMKQNEMFVFPSDDFDPNEFDLTDGKNAAKISPNLYRVQKIATKNYMFRHHLETVVTNDLEFTYKSIRSTGWLRNLVKVRINHLGEIVYVGEY